MKLFKVIALCLLLSACFLGTSQNSKFYTLSPMPVDEISKNYTSFVGVNRVSLPKYMDRPQIVTQGKESVELTISEYNRWVESPTILATRVLTEDLGSMLPAAQIKTNQFGTDKFSVIVAVEVIRMDATLGSKAELVAWYTISNSSGKPLIRKKFMDTVKIGKSYDEVAKGYSELWMKLSQKIANSLVK